MTSSAPATDFTSTAERATDGLSVVYLVYREMLSSIIPSQVITPLVELNKSVPSEVVAHVPLGHLWKRRWRQKLDQMRSLAHSKSLKTTWLVAPPPRAPWLWSDARRLRRWLNRRFQHDERFILHCRGAKMTNIALDATKSLSNARIIYDSRGDEVAEAYDTLGTSETGESPPPRSQQKQIDLMRILEHRAVTTANGVTAVSHALLNTLQSRHRVDLSGRSLVIPCCPDIDTFTPWLPQRNEARSVLGLADKFVVCYLGSLAWYQMPELSLRVFRLIKQIRSDAHFLAITTQPERMEQIVRAHGIAEEDFTIRSYPQTEVPRWLVAADLGLMLRKQDAVNHAASPVKFGEYLAAGVPVVISQELGDASETVESTNSGFVLDITRTDSELLANLALAVRLGGASRDEQSLRCQEVVCRSMCWQVLNDSREQFYSAQFTSVEFGIV